MFKEARESYNSNGFLNGNVEPLINRLVKF